MSQSLVVSIIFCAAIVAVFIYFLFPARRILKFTKILIKADSSDNPLNILEGSILNSQKENYEKTINIEIDGLSKSNIPSNEYFNEINIYSAAKINAKLLDAGSGTLVGLGLLGTFFGLTLGIGGFDSSNSENIQSSIQSLLDGMSTAFLTSLVGMFFSIVYTFCEKRWRNGLVQSLYVLNEKLDWVFYIDDTTLSDYNQSKTIKDLYTNLKEILETNSQNLSETLKGQLSYRNAEGKEVMVANAIREIVINNEEQTKALKSFSSDFALQLNDSFDEVLSRQMQQKILPLMESVDSSTKLMIEHIDKMAVTVSSPATDMIGHIVEELKTAVSTMINEFKAGISNSATKELETIVSSLSTSTQLMGDFPKNIENISTTLHTTIEELKSTTTTMSRFMEGAIKNISNSLQNSMSTITEDISTKQKELGSLQKDVNESTQVLLDAFNGAIGKLEQTTGSMNTSMSLFGKAQGEITSSTAHLTIITNNLNTVSEVYRDAQARFIEKLESVETSTEGRMNELLNLLEESGNSSEEYVQKFEIIRSGLADIFSQIQNGLNNYSNTVRTSIQNYLDAYSRNLTETTSALASTIQQQNEMVEMLVDTVNKKK